MLNVSMSTNWTSDDVARFMEILSQELEEVGITITIDEGSIIYTHERSGIKIVDVSNGIGPVGTMLGMMGTFNEMGEAIKNLVTVPISDNQTAALISFASHIKIENFTKSAVLTELNKGNYAAVPKLMQRWRTGKLQNGKVGIRQDYVARRLYEGELFRTPDWLEYRQIMNSGQMPQNANFMQMYTRLKSAKKEAFKRDYPAVRCPF